MADFNKAIINVLKNEGGFNRNLGDGQGMTYRGLTIKSDPDFKGWAYINQKLSQLGKIKEETIFNELETAVKAYYKNKYWGLIYGEKLENQDVANMCLSFVVASGQARLVINKSINKVFPDSVPERNIFQPETISLLNEYPSRVYPYIYAQRLDYMKGLSTWQKFGKSWTRMMNMFPKTIEAVKKNSLKISASLVVLFVFLGANFLSKKGD